MEGGKSGRARLGHTHNTAALLCSVLAHLHQPPLAWRVRTAWWVLVSQRCNSTHPCVVLLQVVMLRCCCCRCCRACVRFRFLQRPEYITPGTRFVFREGRTKVSQGLTGQWADAVKLVPLNSQGC